MGKGVSAPYPEPKGVCIWQWNQRGQIP